MKKYELSLSRNYVSSWGIEEAIRELLQNAKDSNGEEYDNLIDNQNYEEITFVVKELDSSIKDKMPKIESKQE